MKKEQLLTRAKELVNSGVIQGYLSDILKGFANASDSTNFEKSLEEISQQLYDKDAYGPTVNMFGQELSDIIMSLYPENKELQDRLRIKEAKVKRVMADDVSIEDIAKKFKISIDTLKKELNMGIKIEMEHTDDKSIAKNIAMDHLNEIPDYYTRLNKMEKTASKKWTNESIKPLIKKLLKENLDKKNVRTFILDFGFFMSMNLSCVTQMSKDSTATKELNTMLNRNRAPIINGMNYFDLTKQIDSIMANPKLLSALFSKIREFLVYIEPRIQQFVVDGEKKTKWLEKINDFKERYKNIIQS